MATPQPNPGPTGSRSTDILVAIGAILGISYPVLALSTGVRAVYQALERHDLSALSIGLSGLAAVVYLIAAIAFFVRRRWAWRLGVAALVFETLMALGVGALSFAAPDVVGRTVWRHFGADYGYFPLIQPVLGLVWLAWPETLRRYGLTSRAEGGVAGALRGAWRAFRQG